MAVRIIGGTRFAPVVRDGDSGNPVGDGAADVIFSGDAASDDNAIDGSVIGASGDNEPDSSVVDPSTVGTSSGGSGGTGKRRGRKPGSRNSGTVGGSKRDSSKTTDSLAAMLFSIHLFGAALVKTPELMLSEEEAEQVAKAAKKVTDMYDIPILDEKTMAWFNLGITLAKVYGTRAVAIGQRVKTTKASPPQNRPTPVPRTSAGVTPFPEADLTSSAGVM